MTPEGKVKKEVKRILHEYQVPYFMPVTTQFGGRVGIGDFACCVGGAYVEIETKAKTGKLTKMQEMHRDEIVAAKGIYIVIRESNLFMLPDIIFAIKSSKRIVVA